jgi:predicted DNA-binding protein (MmcQ/YjbR family)
MRKSQFKTSVNADGDAYFKPDVFKSENARQVIGYVKEKYQDELQFLWKRFPKNAVFKRQDNAKWYAALLIVSKRKLGLDEDDAVDILDLRMDTEDIYALVDKKRYFPGYHMNKKHWVTVCLDGSVPIEEIFCMIDESFELAAKRRR